jgi:hypothetical protein
MINPDLFPILTHLRASSKHDGNADKGPSEAFVIVLDSGRGSGQHNPLEESTSSMEEYSPAQGE